MAEGMRMTGKIKNYNEANGYGFIESPRVAQEFGGVDCYLHANALRFSGIEPSQLQPGTAVSFEIHINAQGRPQASSITLAAGGKGAGVYGKAGVPARPAPSPMGKGASKGGTQMVVTTGGTQRLVSTGATGKGPVVGAKGGANRALPPTTMAAMADMMQKFVAAQGHSAPAVAANGKGGKAAVTGKSGGLTAGKASFDVAGQTRKADEAVKNAVGEHATAKVLSAPAEDGSMQVIISSNTLNSLLKAAGFPIMEGSEEVPEDGEPLRGFEGTKVDGGPWFVGTVQDYMADQAYGIVDSADFKAQFPDKECFVHADHIDPEGDGNLVAQPGEEILFPLVEDEEGNAWAWSPVIPRKQNFFGKIESWHGSYGYIKCDTLRPVFESNVYLHANAAEIGGIKTAPGIPVVFQLHVNPQGKPQASSPHPPGLEAKTRQEPVAKRARTAPPASNTPQPSDDDAWYSGEVKSYSEEKGFGFISCEETFAQHQRDVFMHHTTANEAGATSPGIPVSFQLQFSSSGQPQARLIKVEQ